jgi:TetR/AcrR family transcriptional repressor of mexJK operon
VRPAASGRAAGGLRVLQREERRRKFVAAAEALFLRHGYAGTSVNAVVRCAGGSLATLYAEFGTKEGLFEAVIRERVGAAFAVAGAAGESGGDVGARLSGIAARIHERTLSRESLGLYRLAIAEGPRLRALRQAVLETGLDAFLERLADLLARWGEAGELAIEDPAMAAQQFLALVQGQHQFIAGCGAGRRLSAVLRRRHLAAAVSTFLRTYGAPARAADAIPPRA